MIFQLLGQIVRRAWFLILIGWGLLLLGCRFVAPAWNDVAQDKEFAFLPANAPSRQAEEIYKKAFPQDRLSSNIVLVLTDSEPKHLARDVKFIQNVVAPGLQQIAEAEGGLADQAPPSDEPLFGDDNPAPNKKPAQRSIIARIRTPNDPVAGPLLVSQDKKEMLVVVELTTDFLTKRNWPTIDRVEEMIRDLRKEGKIPPDLTINLTGSAVVGRDHARAELASANKTEMLTMVFVVGLLILIYQAPLLALIPLLTVALSVKIALYVLAILGQTGYLTLFQGIQIYVIILAYGAGVDYCLFLTARYKEELDRGACPPEATAGAVGAVGHALVASAATVICGIGMMYFAEFGKFSEAGIAIPLSILIVLFATLTFSPALLRLAGKGAFWPRKVAENCGQPNPPAPKRFYHEGGLDWVWDKVGALLERRAGVVWLATVAAMTPAVIVAGMCYNRLSYDIIGTLPPDLPSVVGTNVMRQHFPAGLLGPTTILIVDPHVDFTSPRGEAVVRTVTDHLRARKDELALADVRSLTAPLGITPAAANPLAGLSDVPESVRREAEEAGAKLRYATSLGERDNIGTRLELVMMHSPFSHRSIDDLRKVEKAIEGALPEKVREESRLYSVGTTPSVRDLADVTRRDRSRIEVLVLASVFLILVLLLRSILLPVYLLLSVLFSYYATLGVSFAVFYLLDPQGFVGIDWKVAIFLFTILIAVGEDYNIFLITRIHEEEKRHGPVGGVREALTRTGPIISSCGLIMAGTFASLLSTSLLEMKQLGFALVFGVLLDTFVVRPILLPAFLIWRRRGRHYLTEEAPLSR